MGLCPGQPAPWPARGGLYIICIMYSPPRLRRSGNFWRARTLAGLPMLSRPVQRSLPCRGQARSADIPRFCARCTGRASGALGVWRSKSRLLPMWGHPDVPTVLSPMALMSSLGAALSGVSVLGLRPRRQSCHHHVWVCHMPRPPFPTRGASLCQVAASAQCVWLGVALVAQGTPRCHAPCGIHDSLRPGAVCTDPALGAHCTGRASGADRSGCGRRSACRCQGSPLGALYGMLSIAH